MKTIITNLLVIATATSLAISCSKEFDNPEEKVEKNTEIESEETTSVQGDGIYTLTLTAPQTKTEFGTGSGTPVSYPKKWTAGDVINVNGINSDPLAAGDAGESTATFHFSEDISGPSYQVVYPATRYNSSTKKVTIPASQTFALGKFDKEADIILGYGTDPASITLSNAVAYLKVRLQKGPYGNFGVKSIKVTSSGKKLCGDYSIADGGLSLTVPDSSDDENEQTVTLNTSGQMLGDEPVEFLIAVAPQTCDIAVTFTDMKDNTQTKNKTGAVLSQGGIRAMGATQFEEYRAIASPADLLAFADACCEGDSNYWLITANIDMDGETWPAAGTADDDSHSFKGTLNGGNNGDNTGYSISNLTSTTGAFVNYLNAAGTIKNLTIASGAINYSSAVSSDLHMGVVGLSHGTISGVYNSAPVTCSSTSISANMYIGGIVGLQQNTGPLSYCVNNANVTCSATNGGTNNVYMGGVAGTVVCEESSDTAIISHCENHGAISRGTLDANSKQSVHHVGGVVGWICASNSYKHTHSYLVNDGNVTGPNYQTATNKIPQLVGGLIGGIHASDGITSKARVIIDHCTVQNCTVQNLFRNNGTEDKQTGMANYGYQCHNGGLIGLARGSGDVESIELSNNLVNNVIVFATRGYEGGLCGYSRGTTISKCNVLSSLVSGAQAFRAGGISGCAYDVVIDECLAQLTKTSDFNTSVYTDHSSLYSGNVFYIGGIAGQVSGSTSTIKNSKAYVNGLCQSTETAGTRGWIAGLCDCTATTIQDCDLGGTYFNKTSVSVTITIDEESDVTTDYIRGSSSTGVTIKGTNGYWDGTVTP